MVVVFSLFISAVFSFFFFAIDIWYFALIPMIFALASLFFNFKRLNFTFQLQGDLSQYSLYGIWAILMIGFSGVLFFLGFEEYLVFLIMIGLNMVLWISSFIIPYDDGKKLFEIGVYLLMGIFLISVAFKYSFLVAWYSLSLFIVLVFALFWFFNTLLKIRYPIEKRYSYQLFVFWVLVVILTLLQKFPENGIWFLCSFLFLAICYLIFRKVQTRIFPKQDSLNISVRRILAGERINKKIKISQWRVQLQDRFNDSPQWFKYFLEIPNLLLLLAVEVQYFYSLFVENFEFQRWIYAVIVLTFLLNCYLMKKIGFVSKISRFAWALVINFSVYFAFWTGWYEDISVILPVLILWTILCKCMLFFLNRSKWSALFNKDDYWYWTIVTCAASFVNVVLICRLNIPWQLLFSLIAFYVGADGLILFYIFKFLRSMDQEENADWKTEALGEETE